MAMFEEEFNTKIFSVADKRNVQDEKIEVIRLQNNDLIAKIKEANERLEKTQLNYKEMFKENKMLKKIKVDDKVFDNIIQQHKDDMIQLQKRLYFSENEA